MNRVRPLAILWLTAMWVLMWGELSLGNFLAGLLLALLITFALPLPKLPVNVGKVRWIPLIGLLANFIWDLIASSLKVAWIALRPSPQPPAALVRVPMRVPDDLVFAFAVGILNLQPGGTVSDFDLERQELTVHLLDGSSHSAIQREIANIQKLETRLNSIFIPR
ncbi:MAG: Na+/H+ antiporter subunit E [Corynebacterium sp.]|nr:Na+/H+ antiporter subunit E [Corynebacterium sp.]